MRLFFAIATPLTPLVLLLACCFLEIFLKGTGHLAVKGSAMANLAQNIRVVASQPSLLHGAVWKVSVKCPDSEILCKEMKQESDGLKMFIKKLWRRHRQG